MNTKDSFSSLSAPQLRAMAEQRLVRTQRNDASGWSAERLLHELQVHQIELEMQNEALRQSRLILEESRDSYLDLYEFAQVGYLTLNASGLISAINLTGATMLGADRQKLLNHRFDRFVAAADLHEWQRKFAYRLQHGGQQGHELRLQREDETIIHVRLDSHLIQSDDAPPTLRLTLSDITAYKQALAELHASEDRLRLAKTAAGLGIFDRDIASGRLTWDERARELWGVGPDDLVSYDTFMAGVHPDDRAATTAAIGRALDPDGNGEFEAEYRVVSHADGTIRQIAANGKCIFQGGRAVRLIGTLRDITPRKYLEHEQRRRRNEMDALVNQQVAAQTAAAIAHELNQPLVSISAYSEAALRMLRSGAKSPEKLSRALEGAMEQAQRAGQTLHQLLDFLHKGDVTLGSVDLNSVISEAIAATEESGYGGFRPILNLEPGLPPVMTNPLQLKKVLINLLSNGVEAMRNVGREAEAILISVSTHAELRMAHVTIQDSGPGFSEERLQRIFEPFFTTKRNGIGLGLAISRALIEAHGGQLWAELMPGVGARFHFTLPFSP